MRAIIPRQFSLVLPPSDHPHVDELRVMADAISQFPQAIALVHTDLMRGGIDPNKGREGISAALVLRAILIKQMNGFSYKQLEFHLGDSLAYRSFCGLGIGENAPSKSALQRSIKAITPETFEAINRMVVAHAKRNKIENGSKVRTDSTVVASPIHEPTDSSLLWDSVRVLVRIMGQAKTLVAVSFPNHRRFAKRRAIAIMHAKSKEQRLPLYRDLLRIAQITANSAQSILDILVISQFDDIRAQTSAADLADQLQHFIALTHRVLDQTHRRVILGESVPAGEKVVSIFEPHTDVIVKDRRETLYGHKICLTAGASGLVLDVVIERGNPADAACAVDMIQRQREIYGRPPRQATFDGGFASRENLNAIKQLGVQDVAFSKGRGLSITEMVKSSWVYRRLRNFRAGVEGVISFLKRCFGLDRCTWRSLPSFKAFVWSSVLASNLLVVARHSLS